MKMRRLFVMIGFAACAAIALGFGSSARLPWLIAETLALGGLLILDDRQTVFESWTSAGQFIFVHGLLLLAFDSENAADFWRASAGVVLLTSLLFESQYSAWSGRGRFCSSVAMSVLFYIFVLLQQMPMMPASLVSVYGIAAFFAAGLGPVFGVAREGAESHVGTLPAALRHSVTGLLFLFYISTYLPDAARSLWVPDLLLGLPLVGIAVASAMFFLRSIERRHILFSVLWTLLIFSAGLSGSELRTFAAFLGVFAQGWSLVLVQDSKPTFERGLDTAVYLNAWALPGSAMFVALCFMVLDGTAAPSTHLNGLLWIFAFLIGWAGLGQFATIYKVPQGQRSAWTWRKGLGLSLSTLSMGLLGIGAQLFSLFKTFWSH